jgi:hypothetical protein
MAVLLCNKNGALVPATTEINAGAPIEIGKPMGLSMLSFFPGTIKNDWGGKAEIMITSEIRFGPMNQAAPRRINMLLQKYNFREAPVISDYGGDVYGDPMLYYSKAYAGQRIGLTLRGVETDKISPSTWKGMEKVISTVGNLALFTSAVPYIGYISIAKNIVRILSKALIRNDRLQTSRVDLYFREENKKLLQTGRYLIWEQVKGAHWATLAKNYRLTGAGSPEPNQLVSIKDGTPFKAAPYFVVQLDRKTRKAYADFEIGAGSAELLENWGDKSLGSTVLDSVQQLAKQVNDANQLTHIEDLVRDLKKAGNDTERAKIKEQIKAHSELFTKNNSALLNELLSSYLK